MTCSIVVLTAHYNHLGSSPKIMGERERGTGGQGERDVFYITL